MFLGLKNKLENVARKSRGKEVLDREIASFLNEKHKDSYDLDRLNDAYENIRQYMDDLELREELLKNKTILDVGSSGHFFDEYCKEKYGSSVVALDNRAEGLGGQHPLGIVGDARVLPFKEDSFDLVISHDSMPHLFVFGKDDENGNPEPIEGLLKEKAFKDVLSLFREVYRVINRGGQIRMNTFSEMEEKEHKKIDQERGHFNNPWPDYQITRVKLIKEAMQFFEKETGARCVFKDERHGGLIIIKKVS